MHYYTCICTHLKSWPAYFNVDPFFVCLTGSYEARPEVGSYIQEQETSVLKMTYWFGVSLCDMLFYILNIVINGYSYVMTWKVERYL